MKCLFFGLVTILFSSSKMNHPFSLTIVLFSQSLVVCLVCRWASSSSWLAMTLFLIMVGGLLIIFIYMTSICSNELFSFEKSNLWYVILILPIFLLPSKSSSNFRFMTKFDFFNQEFFKLLLPVNMQSSIFSFVYLLIILLILINLMEINKGPMRKKY